MGVTLSDKARAFLEEPRFAILATINPDGSVQQTVMWYLDARRSDRDEHRAAAARRTATCSATRASRSASRMGSATSRMRGEITLVEDQPQAQADILELAIRYHGQEQGEEMGRDVFGKQERITLHLPIANVDEHGFDD